MTTVQTPTLMFPSPEEDRERGDVCFLSIEDDKTVRRESKLGLNHRCVGSSYGWLILLDQEADPYLRNPLSGAHIQLPTKYTFPHLVSVSKTQGSRFLVNYKSGCSYWVTLKELQQSLVTKVILSADPCTNNCVVIAIYGFESKVAVFKVGGERLWADIGAKPSTDLIICSSSNHLLSLCLDGNIQVWDLNTFYKIMEIQPCFPSNYFNPVLVGLYSSRSYLVEACGDILLVDRFVGEYVTEEDDVLVDDECDQLVCPYKTLKFRVYRLDFGMNGWVEVESIGNGAVFVGGNQSVWLRRAKEDQQYEANSIYFTDDYWERMDEDYLYGGHDVGVFRLEDKSVTQFCPFNDESEKIDPPPMWILPYPKVQEQGQVF